MKIKNKYWKVVICWDTKFISNPFSLDDFRDHFKYKNIYDHIWQSKDCLDLEFFDEKLLVKFIADSRQKIEPKCKIVFEEHGYKPQNTEVVFYIDEITISSWDRFSFDSVNG